MIKILDYVMRRKQIVFILLSLFGISSFSCYLFLDHQAANLSESYFTPDDFENVTNLNDPESASDNQKLQSSAQTITQRIEQYRQNTPSSILENKKLDQKAKSEILALYRQLSTSQQTSYRDFIQQLEQGSAPQLQYHGQNSYPIDSNIDFSSLITATDLEDGKITLNDENFSFEPKPNFGQTGTQIIVFKAKDQDGNVGSLTIELLIYPLLYSSSASSDNETSPTVDIPALGSSEDQHSVGSGINFLGSTNASSTGAFQADYQKNTIVTAEKYSDFLPLILIINLTLLAAILALFLVLSRYNQVK